MPYTLPAALTTAMDLGVFNAYLRIILIDAGAVEYEVLPLYFKIEDHQAKVEVATFSYEEITQFRIVRGAIINGTPETITTSKFWINSRIDSAGTTILQGDIVLDAYAAVVANSNYDFVLTQMLSTVITYEGTPAWQDYQFYPTGRTIVFSPKTKIYTILKQKYLLYAVQNGLDAGENDTYVFCATDSRTEDYEIEDKLFNRGLKEVIRQMIWRDEASTVHTSGPGNNPFHNLGFILSTDAAPNYAQVNRAESKSSKLRIHLKYRTGDKVTITRDGVAITNEIRIKVTEIFDPNADQAWYQIVETLEWFSDTEGGAMPSTIEAAAPYTPLVTGNFDNVLSENDNNLQAAMETIDDHDHGNLAAAIQAPTATNDFLVGTQIGAIWTWTKKTLAETITILRTSLDSIYSAISHSHSGLVTNGDSHDHAGGDGGQIAHGSLSSIGTNSHATIDTHIASASNPHTTTDANLSTSDVTTNNASTSKHGFLKKLDNAATNYMNGAGNWANPVAPMLLSANGLVATIAASTTSYLAPFTTTFFAATNSCITTLAGTLKNLYLRIGTAQPASGNLICTVLINGVASAITLTIPAGGAGATTYSDTTHTAAVSAGDRISFEFKNNATGASATIGGVVVEQDVATV